MKGILCTMLLTVSGLALHASGTPEDTTFKKDNPKLLYTTRDYYIEVPANCYGDAVCVQEFSLIMTFNVGINSSNEIKQIGFKNAVLEFKGKSIAGQTYKPHTFSKYSAVSSNNGYSVKVDFIPDKANGMTPVLEKFVFTGNVTNNHISGVLQFHTKTSVAEVMLN